MNDDSLLSTRVDLGIYLNISEVIDLGKTYLIHLSLKVEQQNQGHEYNITFDLSYRRLYVLYIPMV